MREMGLATVCVESTLLAEYLRNIRGSKQKLRAKLGLHFGSKS